MIYFARFFALIGGIVTLGGLGTVLVIVLFEHDNIIPTVSQDHWLFILSATAFGAVVLMIGQLLGNDLFKLRGKDSILQIKNSPHRCNDGGMTSMGGGFGGDGGSCD